MQYDHRPEIDLPQLLEDIKLELEGIINEHLDDELSQKIKECWGKNIKEEFNKCIQIVYNENHNQKLKSVGLTGEQLKLKLYIWEKIKKIKKSDIQKWLDTIFTFINSLLSSLSKVILEFDMIKEFKDMLHINIKLTQD